MTFRGQSIFFRGTNGTKYIRSTDVRITLAFKLFEIKVYPFSFRSPHSCVHSMGKLKRGKWIEYIGVLHEKKNQFLCFYWKIIAWISDQLVSFECIAEKTRPAVEIHLLFFVH